MMEKIYEFYRVYGLEWIIYSVLIANGLYQLSRKESRAISRPLYLLLHAVFTAVCIPLTRLIPFTPLFQTQGAAIWVFFVLLIAVTLLFALLFLRKNFNTLLGYDIFYVVLIILYKMVCGPLYSAEGILPTRIYIFLDLALTILLYLILLFMTALFDRFRLDLKISLPKTYSLVLFIPLGIFLFFFLYITGIPLSQNAERSLLCVILIIDLPIIYYLFASIIREYNEHARLDRALSAAQAELDNNRLALELDEKIKKVRHELKNNYFYLRMLLEGKQYGKMDEYLNRVIGETLPSLDHISTGNAMLDHILNQAVAEARTLKIPVSTEIIVRKNLPVSEDALCTILLNLLHNAIEASASVQQKDLHITVKEVQNYLLCKIANRVERDVLSDNPTLATTKTDSENHGLGLKIVSAKVRECNGSFETSVENGYFIATVMLPLVIVG